MLFLIGLGLDVGDLSENAINAIKKCDDVFIERYTSFLPDSYDGYLARATGKAAKELERRDLEQLAKDIVSKAASRNIAVLVPGDPLLVTTHVTLLELAGKLGVAAKTIHAPSILSVAIGESMLDVYKFGQFANVPMWQKDYKPTAFINVVKENMQKGLHSLLFLDIDQEHHKPMALEACIATMKAADETEHAGIFAKDPLVLVLGNVGRASQRIALSRISSAARLAPMFNEMPLSIIVLADLSFYEEAVKKFLV
ncbi:MAG: diphthine synthase [Candidatus Micrarchaeia archaeon]